MQLEEQFYETDRAKLTRWLPWVHLLRSFRIATRWRNLLLAVVGITLLAVGRYGISYLPFSSYAEVKALSRETIDGLPRTDWPWEQSLNDPQRPRLSDAPLSISLDDPISTLRSALSWPTVMLTPLRQFVQTGSNLFDRNNSWASLANGWTELLLLLVIWSFFATAITRRVAVEFAGAEEIGLRETFAFASREFRTTCAAPLIALVGIGLLWLMGSTIGWIGNIPGIGEPIAALLWGVQFLFGVILALILLGVAVAWPLMVAAHSAEGTDAFDALNRAYNYVFVRPWYSLWLLTVTIFYGSVVLYFLTGLVGVSLHLTEWMGGPHVNPGSSFAAEGSVAAAIGQFWSRGLASVLHAFIYSFFWTAVTISYFLLRKSVDAYPLNRVHRPSPATEANQEPLDPNTAPPPLVGIPESERREEERKKEQPGTDENATASE